MISGVHTGICQNKTNLSCANPGNAQYCEERHLKGVEKDMNILLGQKAKTTPTENTMMAPQKSSRTPIHLLKTRVSEYETHS